MRKLLTRVAIVGFAASMGVGFSAGEALAHHGPTSFCPTARTIYAQDLPSVAHFPNIYADDTAVVHSRTGAQLAVIPQLNDTHVIWPQDYEVTVLAGDILFYRGYFIGHSLTVQFVTPHLGTTNVVNFNQDTSTLQVPHNGIMRFPHGTVAAEKNALILCPNPNPILPPPQLTPPSLPVPQPPTVETGAASNVGQTGAMLRGTVNPNGSPTIAWFEWGSTLSFGNVTTPQAMGNGIAPLTLSSTLSGLQTNTTYYVRVAAQNAGGIRYGAVVNFRTLAQPPPPPPLPPSPPGEAPLVVTQPASSITQTSATLTGTVNPNGSPTNAWFEWGSTPSLGNATPSQPMGSGSNAGSISFTLSNLSSNTTHYFRAVAQNTFGLTQGATISFVTGFNQPVSQGGAPIVSTGGVSSVTQNFATASGTVNPNGSPTNAWFEWGSTPNFGNTTGFVSVGSGTASVSISGTLSGLTPGFTYYVRAVAQNGFGSSQGNTVSFTAQGQFTTFLPNQPGAPPTVFTHGAANISPTSATLQGTVYPNNATTNIWFEWGETPSMSFSGGFQTITLGNISFPFSFPLVNLSPGTTYYFRAAAQNSFGTSYGNIQTFRASTMGGTPTGSFPSAITSSATFVTPTSALMNGRVNPNGGVASGRFEWGVTPALGNVTPLQPLGSGTTETPLSWFLAGLTPNTAYYFRAIGENGAGRGLGAILTFTTERAAGAPATPTPPPTGGPRQPTPPPTEGGPTLTLASLVDNIEPDQGDEIVYSLTYQNTNPREELSRLMLKVTIPTHMAFRSSSIPPATQVGNVHIFDLGDLGARAQGSISLKLTVTSAASRGETLVLNAVIDYLDARRAPQSVSAYATVSVGGVAAGENFLASLFSTIQIPVGWLVLLLFIVTALMLAMRRILRPITATSYVPRERRLFRGEAPEQT